MRLQNRLICPSSLDEYDEVKYFNLYVMIEMLRHILYYINRF